MSADTKTDNARHGARRYRRAFASSIALTLARGCALVSMLLLVPVLLRHLDAERFGLWMAFTSVLASMSFADLGLGHGLMTAVATASVAGDRTLSRRIIASGVAAVSGIAVPALLLIALVGWLAPWNRWLGAPGVPESELRFAVIALLTGMVAGGIAGLAARVQSGMQSGYIGSMWAAAATLGTLVAVVTATRVDAGFPWLVAILVGMPVLAGAANSLWYFGRHAVDLRPSLRYIAWEQMRALFRLGLLFFVLQVAAGLAFATDNLMLAAILGADSVPPYAVPARLFGCISLFVAIMVQPLWPAYAEAAARRDFAWIRSAFLRSLLLACGVSITASALLFVLRDQIFPLWTQSDLVIDDRVVAMLAIWAVIDSCSIALAMLLNGLNVVRFQVIIAMVLVAASFPARYLLLTELGAWGLPLATIIVYTCVGIIPCALVIPRLLRNQVR